MRASVLVYVYICFCMYLCSSQKQKNKRQEKVSTASFVGFKVEFFVSEKLNFNRYPEKEKRNFNKIR